MAAYMAQRIIDGVYSYGYVIDRRPDLKEGIDTYLTDNGHANLIEGSE
ncbi:hypothetical protein PAT3040_04175 [Paenibacillus agaridevorans]|uniref:Uncharacterized protein n=1 Tax=Paenibacillus agaridevorans TaxID=171404 RepID=A0A2R5ETQ3_9BACL|nr:hypothetical protein [Paenibacillus agaridevorans]GBG09525.1 hypothetical protein PAT3040_04175 [Paenibacillus agaridevorans]